MAITPSQCRAAREFLRWSRDDLEEISKVGRETIGNFERGDVNPTPRTVIDLERAFENAGIRFIDDEESEGVRLLKKKTKPTKKK
jgi:transcriptional regulator with XRE-family HTH domain